MNGLYGRWILANGVGEAAGLGTTFFIGFQASRLIDESNDVLTVVGGALAAVVLGTLLEGVVVGAAQERVLLGRLSGLRPRAWVVATAVGAGLAWLVGMVPSSVMALTASNASGAPLEEPTSIAQYALAAALGLVAGPILGCAQWIILRRLVGRASRWLWANALAWAVGMPLIFLGMDHVPWSGPALGVILAIYGVCAVSGLVVGAIHGQALIRLIRFTQPATLE